GQVAELQAKGRGGVFTDLQTVDEELYLADEAVAVQGEGIEGDVGGRAQRSVIARTADVHDGRQVARAGQFQVESQIAAGRVGLMDFDGQEVRPVAEQSGTEISREEIRFIRAIDGKAGV